MVSFRQVSSADEPLLAGLCELLVDSVQGGASVGFLAPLSRQAATGYWKGVLASTRDGVTVWVAEDAGRVVGSVQLAPSGKENAPHRAEIRKLLVHGEHRGRGIASRLMSHAESFAASTGRTLLVLDVLAGSTAESVYRRLGWQKAGEIPGYAAGPDGRLHPTVIYYKLVSA